VTGALALLLSEFRSAPTREIKQALVSRTVKPSVVPPLMNVFGAWRDLHRRYGKRGQHRHEYAA
jgi:hypothetical protein